MSAGHHPVHVGLQSHSVGSGYPLAVVGYGHPTLYVLENLTLGTVLCSAALEGNVPYQTDARELHFLMELRDNYNFSLAHDKWVVGRPVRTPAGELTM